MTERYDCFNVSYIASSLFDGGWRSNDAEELKDEYDFTEEQLKDIVKELERLENK